MHPSTDPREAALRWHWGQLFLQILVWLNLEERWDGISSVRKIWSQKRWLSVLMGLTQYFNQLTLSSYPRCPKQPANIWRSFFNLSSFPSIFSCPSVSCFPVCLFLFPSFTLFPSCSRLHSLLIVHLCVTLCVSYPLSVSQHGIYEDKCDPKDTWCLFSSKSQYATM